MGGIRRGLVGGVVLLVGRVSRSKVDMRDTSSHSLDLRDGLKGIDRWLGKERQDAAMRLWNYSLIRLSLLIWYEMVDLAIGATAHMNYGFTVVLSFPIQSL